jgi:hypothetical protein
MASLLVACVALPASATPNFNAQVTSGNGPWVVKTDSSPISATDSGGNANGSFQGFSFAGSFVGTKGDAGGGYLGGVDNSATSYIDDVTISGPGTSVMVTVTLPFVSFFSGEYETLPNGNSGFQGGLEYGVIFPGYTSTEDFGVSGSSSGDNYTLPPQAGWSLSVAPTYGITLLQGPLGVGAIHDVSYVINGSLQFTTTVPVGSPFAISFSVGGKCGAGGGNSFLPATCQFDAYDPWGLVPGFDSFDLPDGYSINAPSIDLVDGVVPLSGTGGVPEPAIWTVMLIGFGGLGAMMRGRKRMSAVGVV